MLSGNLNGPEVNITRLYEYYYQLTFTVNHLNQLKELRAAQPRAFAELDPLAVTQIQKFQSKLMEVGRFFVLNKPIVDATVTRS